MRASCHTAEPSDIQYLDQKDTDARVALDLLHRRPRDRTRFFLCDP
jgi:hypothetical protein